MYQRGFTLIELLVVLLIVVLVWVSVLPMIQPDQQRQGREWLNQAQSLLMLSCDLSAQTLQTHRVLWQSNKLQLQAYTHQRWQNVSDAEVLDAPSGWDVFVHSEDKINQKDVLVSWLCRPDGEQGSGQVDLKKQGLGILVLSWQGDGRYVQTTKGL